MTKKQKIIIAVIALATLAIGAIILLADKSQVGHDAHSQAEGEHKEHISHEDKHSTPSATSRVEKQHHDEEHKDDEKIAFSDVQLKTSGIGIHTAQPQRIKTSLQLPGEIRFNEDNTVHVAPRIAGTVQSVFANLGDTVKNGQVLAIIASNVIAEQRSALMIAQRRLELAETTFKREKKLWEEKISAEQDYLQARQTLREAEIEVQKLRQQLLTLGADTGSSAGMNLYEIKAPLAGTVVEKRITRGESVSGDTTVFTVADLATVWAEISVSPRELPAVRTGAPATVNTTAFDSTATGKVSYVGTLIGEQTRTAKARIVLPNPDGAWRPGLFVNVSIVSGDTQVPVAVSSEAVHSFNGKNVVFVQVPGGFMPQPVAIGIIDGKFTEIKEGLTVGTRYAAAWVSTQVENMLIVVSMA